ncbi:type IX secretion system membrane protein PorP/SprF [Vibrio sp. JPW-9-11-11]|uniref:conjugal transfer protein TraF n=1 Tax=Vibrio sp. JPW-9-11-11 TaxID=1416532 RepID=UPI001592C060|nr:conjugal transfer protein TraF [Vibrio sp. JPW-9-11-11]NVD07960.1 type IX secretion system membrane protein PorP/SprF [Vibrio sp. JPW-9-11-11]
MNQFNKITVVIGLLVCSSAGYAATVVPDGRGNGMGNTGVSSADYVLAPFYNPALTAIYRDSDDFGVLLPAVGATLRDTDESLDTIDSLQDTIKQFENGGSSDPTQATTLNNYLTQLSDNKPLAVTGGAAMAVALPINTLSANMFLRGYAEVVASPEIAADGGNTPSAVQTRYENSNVDMIAFGYSEFGVALAKRVAIAGQDVSLGVTPKYQQLKTYKQSLSVEDFDLDDYDQSETKKSAFNLDLGAVWLVDNYRLGVAVKDLFSKEIDTKDIGGVSRYKLNTQLTVSGTYMMEYFSATIDFDMTKQERFLDLNDETQFLRVGVEGNAFGWAQLRAGYQTDVQDTLDDEVTLGIGISPGDLVSIDLAGSYAGDNQFGLSGNLSFTF